MSSTATLSSKSQLTIPAWARRALGLKPGARVSLRVEDGRLVLERVDQELIGLEGSLADVYGDAREYVNELREDRDSVSLVPEGHTRIAIDTAPLVCFLAGDPRRAGLVREVLSAGARGELELVVSVVTEAELLVAPLRSSAPEGATRAVRQLLDGVAEFDVVAISRDTARRAAGLRVDSGLKLADALIAATALGSGCTALLSNDVAFRRVTDLQYLHLDDAAG